MNLIAWVAFGFAARYVVHLLKTQSGYGESSLVSTPSNSWTRVKEGSFLWKHGINPYEGDLFHGSPLTLALGSRVDGEATAAVFCALDVLVAVVLFLAARKLNENFVAKEELEESSFCDEAKKTMMLKHRDGFKVAVNVLKAYLFCPYTVLNAAEFTTSVLSNFYLSCFLLAVSHGRYGLTAVCLALAAYEDFYPLALLIPAAYMAYKNFNSKSYCKDSHVNFVCFMSSFLWSTAALLAFSHHLMGSWSFLGAKYGFLWSVPDLTPNIGLFWYFFTEMFEHFKVFFICSFQINAFIYAAPLLIKFHRDPMIVIYSLLALTSIFKSYPCVGDVGLYLSLLPIWAHLCASMRQLLVTCCFFLATSTLAPVLWHLWLFDGSANANFFFGITLGFAAAQILLLSDVLFSYMRREYELVHGRKKDDKPFVLALQ